MSSKNTSTCRERNEESVALRHLPTKIFTIRVCLHIYVHIKTVFASDYAKLPHTKTNIQTISCVCVFFLFIPYTRVQDSERKDLSLKGSARSHYLCDCRIRVSRASHRGSYLSALIDFLKCVIARYII